MGINFFKKYLPFSLPILATLVGVGSLIASLESNSIVVVSYFGTIVIVIGYMVLLSKAIVVLFGSDVGDEYLINLLAKKTAVSLLVYLAMLFMASVIGYFFISSLVAFLFSVLLFSKSCGKDSALVIQLDLCVKNNVLIQSLILNVSNAYDFKPQDDSPFSCNPANGQAMTGYTDSSGCLPGCGTPSWPAEPYRSNSSNNYDW